MKNSQKTIDLLKHLDALFNTPNLSNNFASLYSKSALLELCGWLEEAQDELVLNYAKTKLIDGRYKDLENAVQKNYHFSYENFRKMLTSIIDFIGIEKLEAQLETLGTLDILCSEIGAIKKLRDTAAHKSLDPVTQYYETPSKIIDRLNRICSCLTTFEEELAKLTLFQDVILVVGSKGS